MDRSSTQKINKETQDLNDTSDKLDLIDISGHYIQKQKNTPSSQAYMKVSRVDNIVGHKSNLSKFNKIVIVSSIFSDQTLWD